MRFHVSQKRIAIILLPIFDKLQFVVSICQKTTQGTINVTYLAYGTNFFPKITTAKTPTTADRQLRHAHRDFISCNIIVDFWYCLALCILYSTKSKETSMKRSASAHVSLKYRQRIFYTLLRAYCFPNNFYLNLVE